MQQAGCPVLKVGRAGTPPLPRALIPLASPVPGHPQIDAVPSASTREDSRLAGPRNRQHRVEFTVKIGSRSLIPRRID